MPPWVYASWAIGLFLYQTFDAVDGTQAYAEPGSCFKIVTDGAISDGEHVKVGLWESFSTMVYVPALTED